MTNFTCLLTLGPSEVYLIRGTQHLWDMQTVHQENMHYFFVLETSRWNIRQLIGQSRENLQGCGALSG